MHAELPSTLIELIIVVVRQCPLGQLA